MRWPNNYPNHDRNHNAGRDDLRDVELVVAQQRVFHGRERPSRLIVAVDQRPSVRVRRSRRSSH